MTAQANPLVSVCVQCYNHEDYIEQCLESILSQEANFDFEILLGEDDSSDNSREICKRYADEHPDKIKLVLRQREDVIYIAGRPSGRFNFIENLKRAKGTYIALCDGDDYWSDPLKLQKQVDLLESRAELAGCFHDTEILIDDLPESLSPWRTYDKTEFSFKDTIGTKSLFHTSAFLFRADYLKILNWFRKVQSGDMALFSIVASAGNLCRIPRFMSVYRKSGQGITTDLNQREYHKQRIYLMRCLQREFPDFPAADYNSVINFHKSQLKQLFWNRIKKGLKKVLPSGG